MSGTPSQSFASELDAPLAAVWEVVGTMRGVNAELGPWLFMTSPAAASTLRLDDAPVGVPLFESWLLLGHVLPIDRHAFKLEAVTPGRGFVERSTSWTERSWEHRRHLEPLGDARCVVEDRLTFTPRVSLVAPVLARVIRAVFEHRHRQLRRRFGGLSRTVEAPSAEA